MFRDRYLLIVFRGIATLLFVYLAMKVDFLFAPLASLIYLFTAPFIAAGFLYYILRPVFRYTDRKGVKRPLAILAFYVMATALIVGLAVWVWPVIQSQSLQFMKEAPALLDNLKERLFSSTGVFSGILPKESEMTAHVGDAMKNAFSFSADYLAGVYHFVSQFLIVLTTVPLILYYMLKDGEKFPKSLADIVPFKYRKDTAEILRETDEVLSSYIVGRFILTALMSVLLLIGLLIIGLPSALLLTLIAGILNFIPFIGPILSAVPILLVAFTESPMMALWALLILVAAQQIEENWLAPVVYGKKMDIHPLTTIIVVLVGAHLAGVVGLILSIPFYMAVKIAVRHVYQLYLLNRYEPESTLIQKP
jgi:predicted PurR-regulated permease PerM